MADERARPPFGVTMFGVGVPELLIFGALVALPVWLLLSTQGALNARSCRESGLLGRATVKGHDIAAKT